jgi:basic membrane protein A
MKLAAILAVGTMALAACGGGKSVSGDDDASDKKSLKVGLAYDIGGRGDKSFNDAAAAGLDKVKADLDLQVKDLSAKANEPPADKEERLRLLAQGGYNPVIAVGFAYAESLTKVSKEFPDTKFGIVDGVVEGATNVTGLVFAEEQGSFLVGAAAALKTKKNNVGYIGGCLVPLLQKFQAGFAAGAKAVKPNITIQVKYLSNPPQCTGFNDPAAGKTTADGMYDTADVIYAAAGGSGSGVFEAAKANNALAIGVDSDQYQSADPAVRDVIMTSMLKRVDVAVFDFVKGVGEDQFKAGTEVFDLKVDGVGYSTSGGQVDDIKSKLEDYKQQIIDGKIKVPDKPAAA